MTRTTRRTFVKLAAAGVLPAATRTVAAPTAAPAPPPGPPVVHAFAKPLQRYSVEETAQLLAGAGYGGIDFAVRPGGHVEPERVAQDLPRAVAAARAAGLRVDMIVTAITDPQARETDTVLRAAADCGVRCYRTGWLDYDAKLGVAGTLAKLRPRFAALAKLNEQLGLHGAYQNHAGTRVGGPVWDLHELLRDCDPRWIGCQYDVRHAMVEGTSAWPLGLKLLHPWIRCYDVKDFRWTQRDATKPVIENVPLGEGIVDFDQFFRLVKQLGIPGPCSVHLEYPPFEGRGQPADPAALRQLFARHLRQDRERLAGWLSAHGLA